LSGGAFERLRGWAHRTDGRGRPRRPGNLLAVATLAGGLGVIALVAGTTPRGLPPLYDGVVPIDPYRYLSPAPGQPGNPTSYTATVPLTGTSSPNILASTTETPPQAQLIASTGAFVLPSGTASVVVAIKPVPPPLPAPPAGFTGNVYEISIVTSNGTALDPAPATPVTILLRAPAGVDNATIVHLSNGAWQTLDTQPAGLSNIFLVNATQLGDYAVVATTSPSLLGQPLFFLALAVVAIALGVTSFLYFDIRRHRRVPAPDAPRATSRRAKRRPNQRR